jgi:predicted nucleic acid-binding protein
VTYYLDTSAAAKLVKSETETPALASLISHEEGLFGRQALVSADLLQTELIATVLRAQLPLSHAMRVLAGVYLIRMTPEICEAAGSLSGERGLRSLDALHLAVAVSLRASLTGIITYDTRMAEAATSLGFVVESPR